MTKDDEDRNSTVAKIHRRYSLVHDLTAQIEQLREVHQNLIDLVEELKTESPNE